MRWKCGKRDRTFRSCCIVVRNFCRIYLFVAMKHIWADSRYTSCKSRDGARRPDRERTCFSRFLQLLRSLDERRSNVFPEQAFQFLVLFTSTCHDDRPLVLKCANPRFESVVCFRIRIPPLPKVL